MLPLTNRELEILIEGLDWYAAAIFKKLHGAYSTPDTLKEIECLRVKLRTQWNDAE